MPTWTCLKCGFCMDFTYTENGPWKGHKCQLSPSGAAFIPSEAKSPETPRILTEKAITKDSDFQSRWGKWLTPSS